MKPKTSGYIYLALITISIIFLLSFGILGVGRGVGSSGFDGAYLYAAGRAWLTGRSPYDYQQFVQSVAGIPNFPGELRDFFAYPPQIAFFSLPLGLLSFPASKFTLTLLNLLSIAHVVWMGQTTLLILMTLYLSFNWKPRSLAEPQQT